MGKWTQILLSGQVWVSPQMIFQDFSSPFYLNRCYYTLNDLSDWNQNDWPELQSIVSQNIDLNLDLQNLFKETPSTESIQNLFKQLDQLSSDTKNSITLNLPRLFHPQLDEAFHLIDEQQEFTFQNFEMPFVCALPLTRYQSHNSELIELIDTLFEANTFPTARTRQTTLNNRSVLFHLVHESEWLQKNSFEQFPQKAKRDLKNLEDSIQNSLIQDSYELSVSKGPTFQLGPTPQRLQILIQKAPPPFNTDIYNS